MRATAVLLKQMDAAMVALECEEEAWASSLWKDIKATHPFAEESKLLCLFRKADDAFFERKRLKVEELGHARDDLFAASKSLCAAMERARALLLTSSPRAL